MKKSQRTCPECGARDFHFTGCPETPDEPDEPVASVDDFPEPIEYDDTHSEDLYIRIEGSSRLTTGAQA
jgi:hypothetical protein